MNEEIRILAAAVWVVDLIAAINNYSEIAQTTGNYDQAPCVPAH
jgi:hypothetical protein